MGAVPECLCVTGGHHRLRQGVCTVCVPAAGTTVPALCTGNVLLSFLLTCSTSVTPAGPEVRG